MEKWQMAKHWLALQIQGKQQSSLGQGCSTRKVADNEVKWCAEGKLLRLVLQVSARGWFCIDTRSIWRAPSLRTHVPLVIWRSDEGCQRRLLSGWKMNRSMFSSSGCSVCFPRVWWWCISEGKSIVCSLSGLFHRLCLPNVNEASDFSCSLALGGNAPFNLPPTFLSAPSLVVILRMACWCTGLVLFPRTAYTWPPRWMHWTYVPPGNLLTFLYVKKPTKKRFYILLIILSG